MDEREDSLAGHLEALRSTLWRMLAGTAVLFPVGYALAPALIRLLVRRCLPPDVGPLYFFAPMEAFWTRLRLGFVVALAFGFPWNLWHAWRFLAPGLYDAERAVARRWVAFASALFALGAAFSLFLITPLVVRFGAGFATADLKPMLGLAGFVGLAGWMALAFGVMFQAPIATVAAVRLGLVSPDTLSHARPYVIVGILVLAAILTPPDVVSQVLLATPTWLLFELGLLLARRPQPRG